MKLCCSFFEGNILKSFIKIVVIENEVQAQYLKAVLKDKGIPHQLMSYHDSAYDGVFQNLKGWGHVEGPEEFQTEILEIIKELGSTSQRAK